MRNSLITGATHALSQKIARNLEENGQLYFADAQPIPELLLKSGKYLKIPYATQPSFAHELLTLALDKAIDIIIPLRDKEIKALSSCKPLFEEYGIRLAVPDFQELEELDFLINPPANLLLSVWIDGICISKYKPDNESAPEEKLNGLCILSDAGADCLHCCIK